GVDQTIVGKLLRAEKSYIVVRGEVAGKSSDVTIFRADIRSMHAADAAAVKVDDSPAKTAQPGTSAPAPATAKAPGKGWVRSVGTAKEAVAGTGEYLKAEKPGVFLLPLEGPVGETFRHEEIVDIGKEADKYGPGQIIVLRIKSPGGSVAEMDIIH